MKNKYLSLKGKDLRKRKASSLEDLSENSRVSLKTIQRIENGESEPTGETLKRISTALNVNPEELVDWTISRTMVSLKL